MICYQISSKAFLHVFAQTKDEHLHPSNFSAALLEASFFLLKRVPH